MPLDQDVTPSELRIIAMHLSTFDEIREEAYKLFQGLDSIKELVESEYALFERTDREGELAYAAWRGYTAMSLHVASVNGINMRLRDAMQGLLRAVPRLESE